MLSFVFISTFNFDAQAALAALDGGSLCCRFYGRRKRFHQMLRSPHCRNDLSRIFSRLIPVYLSISRVPGLEKFQSVQRKSTVNW